jgi:hypothetical protein
MTSDPPKNSSTPSQECVTEFQPLLYRRCGCWVPTVICVVACLALPVAYFLGAGIEQLHQKHRSAMHQMQRMESLFAEHPDKFGSLTAYEVSGGYAVARGTVKTQIDRDFVVARFHEMFGDDMVDFR